MVLMAIIGYIFLPLVGARLLKVHFTRLAGCSNSKFDDRRLGMELILSVGGSVAQQRKDLEAWHS